MGGGDHVGPGRVYLRVDRERRGVHALVAFDHLPVVVHEQQVGHRDLAEVHCERIDPEVVEQLGVARRDVAGDAFVEPVAREPAERGGEALLTVQPFGFEVGHRSGLRLAHFVDLVDEVTAVEPAFRHGLDLVEPGVARVTRLEPRRGIRRARGAGREVDAAVVLDEHERAVVGLLERADVERARALGSDDEPVGRTTGP